QARAVAMGIEGQRVQRASGERPVARDALRESGGAFARHRLAQRDVARPQVARRERRRLVVDDVGLERRQVHGPNLLRRAVRRSQAAESTCQPGKASTAGWQRSATASFLARSMPRLTRPVSILEIVACGIPQAAASSAWVMPCNSRMMRTDSPGVTSTRLRAATAFRMS